MSQTCLGGGNLSFKVMKFCLGLFGFCLHHVELVLQQNEENVQTKTLFLLCFILCSEVKMILCAFQVGVFQVKLGSDK